MNRPNQEGTKRMKFTEKQLIEALQSCGGFRTATAKLLNVSRSAVSNRINKSPKLLQIVDDIEESRLDIAESALINALKDGDPWAIQFYLKRKGQRRGYIEKQELEVSTTAPEPVLITMGEVRERLRLLDESI